MTIVDDVIINAPTKNETNDNLYIFNLSKSNDESVAFQSEEFYNVNCSEEEQMLTIPSKSDLKELSGVYNEIKAKFLNKHEEWFEEKFTSSTLDDLFKNFLQPNIVENCIDLKVFVPSSTLEKLKTILETQGNTGDLCEVKPLFLFDSIVLEVNTNKMYCRVILNDFNVPQEITENPQNVLEEEPVGLEEESVEESGLGKDCNEESQKEERPANHVGDNDELVELEFDTSNLAESKIKMNAEDYLIIYKYILGQIKENKVKDTEKIFQSKGIDMEVLDCREIFNDSDDDYFSSDSESETSNDES